MTTSSALKLTSPITEKVRVFFAPIDRISHAPIGFDAALQGRFALNSPPTGWMDGGDVFSLDRRSETKILPLACGTPAMARDQVRQHAGATVGWVSQAWHKIQLALNSGTQQLNLLAEEGDVGTAPALAVLESSTAQQLVLADISSLTVGDVVVVDTDYTGQVGYIGTPISGGYIDDSSAGQTDVHTIRRVSFNIAIIVGLSGNTVFLDRPLPAGNPVDGMALARVKGFADREGSSFFQEWSALFVIDGAQGDRVIFYYPRLQRIASAETTRQVQGPWVAWDLKTEMRALPIVDAHDGETVFCYRSYLPALMREVL